MFSEGVSVYHKFRVTNYLPSQMSHEIGSLYKYDRMSQVRMVNSSEWEIEHTTIFDETVVVVK